jgi:hypothetical protein
MTEKFIFWVIANMQPSSIKNGSVGFSEKSDWSDDDFYTNNDCINDLIDNTNLTQVCYYLACFFLLEFFLHLFKLYEYKIRGKKILIEQTF